MKEKKLSKYEKPSFQFPPEIIWLIFNYADMATLARCSSVCIHWNLLTQPFWVKELTTFLETLKTERERLSDIDVLSLVKCAQEKGSTTSILNQLHQQETKINKYQGKLSILEEKEREKAVTFGQQVIVASIDPIGGCYVSYGSGHQPSFFGDIKRMFNKSLYGKNIEEAEKQESRIIRKLV